MGTGLRLCRLTENVRSQRIARGTPLERARLDLVVLPATLECLSCGHIEPFLVDHHHSHDPLPVAECPGAVNWPA